ncbi:MAG: PEP-CTERM sorting domain-containing protein [Phycisphaerae bacterium]|nr:PEP-CTERM sorting domain-containing protein [Phycisphaerae bacterium]
MKKLLSAVMVLAMAGFVSAGQGFSNNGGDTSWGNAGNWSQGYIVDDSTTNPGDFVPQWANTVEFRNNAVMDIGDGEARQTYAFQMGVYGSDNTVLNMSGGSLTVGGWGMDIGRGSTSNANHDGDATINMTGGVISTPWLLVGNDFNSSDTAIVDIDSTINMSSGIINVGNHMRIGMNHSTGTVNLSGDAVVNVGSMLQMNTKNGWNEPDEAYGALLTINDGAEVHVTGVGAGTPEDMAAALAEEMGMYNMYKDFGWITTDADDIKIEYNEATNIISITAVPEPMSMVMLGLGGLALIKRRKN